MWCILTPPATSETWYRYFDRTHSGTINWSVPAGGTSGSYLWTNPLPVFGEKANFNWSIPRNDIKFGEYYINQTYTSKNDFEPLTHSGIIYAITSKFEDESLFAQDKIKLLKNLSITPGLDYAILGYNNVTNNYVTNGPYSYTENRNYELEPSIGINYRLLHNLILYGNYSTIYSPSYTSVTQANNYTPTYLSKPTTVEDAEIGFKILIKKSIYLHHFVFNANYFQNSLGKAPLTTFVHNNIPPNYGQLLISYDKSFYKGISIDAEDNPINNLHVYLNYTGISANYTYYINSKNLLFNGYPVSNVPDYTFNVGAFYRIPENSSIYTVKLWDTDTGSQYLFNNLADHPSSSQKMPAYDIVNTSISLRTILLNNIIPGVKTTDLSFSVYNLLNKEYNSDAYISSGGYFGGNSAGDILAYPGAPREFFLSATMKF